MKAVLIILLVIAGIVVGAYFYLTHSMSYQPDWYHPEEAHALAEQMKIDAPDVEEKIQRQWQSKKSDVVISANDLSTLIYKQTSSMKEQNLHKAVKAVHSEIEPDKVKVEIIVDVNQIPRHELPASILKTVDKLISVLPEKALKNLCVTVDGKPHMKDGRLVLDENASIKAAGISIPVSDIMSKFKISPEEIEKLDLRDLDLQANRIILRR